MSNDGDQELIALISREQRGFRRVMYFGIAVLVAMAVMSGALGVYYMRAQEQIASAVARQQFDARRERQTQASQINSQRIHIRRISDELRGMGRTDVDGARTADAISAARAYLGRGQLGLVSERLIEAATHSQAAQGAERAVLEGVANLIAFDREGGSVQAGASALPQRLQQAQASFELARTDPVLGQLANAGLAAVLNFEAQRLSYTQESCSDLFSAVAASAASEDALAPRQLFWRANCERKLGQSPDAFRDYAAMLAQGADAARNPNADYAVLDLAMNGYHGVGTTLIAMHGDPGNRASMQEGLEIAQRECAVEEQTGRSPEMALAIACLNRAMELRRRLGQNAQQVAGGTGENVGFAYLRDDDFSGALQHASTIERDSLSAWNELVRALAAEHVAAGRGEGARAARDAARDARRNISFFTPAQFDLCEVRRLLNEDLYEEAVALVRREHRGAEMPVCSA